ncbi:MAG: protein O-mannosyl-transferase family [Candidatus Velthaea sp.]
MSRPAVAVGALACTLYVWSLPPGLGWWDTAEYQTVPYIAGILHPTGFPAYTIAGWLFSHVFIAGNVAWRMSVMSALCVSSAAALLFDCARRSGASWAAAAAAAAVFVTSDIMWVHATRAGVESLTLLFGALALTNALAWHGTRAGAHFVRAGLFAGLAVATHPIAIWFLPGMAILVCTARRPWQLRALAAAVAAFVAGLGFYAYLPLRSAAVTAAHLDPAATILGVVGQPFWDYDHPATAAGFMRLVSGADFGAGGTLRTLADAGRIPAYVVRFGAVIAAHIGWIGAFAAAGGVIANAPHRPIVLGLIATAFLVIPFSLSYGVLVDADKYYLLLVWIAALFAALGASAVPRLGPLPAMLLAAAAGFNFHNNAHLFEQRAEHNGAMVVADALAATPEDAVIYAGWSYVTPLAYAAYVDHNMGSRIPVTNAPHADMVAWTRLRPVFYMPFPENDLDVPGARLELLANTYPKIYRVVPQRATGGVNP